MAEFELTLRRKSGEVIREWHLADAPGRGSLPIPLPWLSGPILLMEINQALAAAARNVADGRSQVLVTDEEAKPEAQAIAGATTEFE